jgi:hypothetical protein
MTEPTATRVGVAARIGASSWRWTGCVPRHAPWASDGSDRGGDGQGHHPSVEICTTLVEAVTQAAIELSQTRRQRMEVTPLPETHTSIESGGN